MVGRHGDSWKLRVAAAPERGRANHALLDLLAETLHIPRAHVELLSGGAARDKVVVVHGMEPAQADQLLEAAAGVRRVV